MAGVHRKSDAFIVQWSDTDTFSIPKMEESWNGWNYRPDEARTASEIKSGRNKSFGMGREGSRLAKQWFEDYIRSDIQRHKGQVPKALVPKPVPPGGIGSSYRPAMAIIVDHPTFGQIRLTAAQGTNSVTYSVEANRYVAMLTDVGARFTLGSLAKPTTCGSVTVQASASTTVQDLFKAWLKDPVGVTVAKTHEDGLRKLFDLYEIPEIHDVPEPIRNGEQEYAGFTFVSTQDAHLLFGKGRELAIKGGVPALGELVTALNHGNAKVRLVKQYDYASNEYAVTGVSIRVEASEEHGNRHGHEVVITTDGVKVVCGYVDDEKAWIEYQRRHAADLLSSLGQSTVARETTEYKMKE